MPSSRRPREYTGRPNLAYSARISVVIAVEETLHQLLLFPGEERTVVPSVHSASSRYTGLRAVRGLPADVTQRLSAPHGVPAQGSPRAYARFEPENSTNRRTRVMSMRKGERRGRTSRAARIASRRRCSRSPAACRLATSAGAQASIEVPLLHARRRGRPVRRRLPPAASSDAADDGAAAVLITIDTPGGLDLVDAGDHAGRARVTDPGDRLRRAAGRAGRLGRGVRPALVPRRRDGSGHERRRVHPGRHRRGGGLRARP